MKYFLTLIALAVLGKIKAQNTLPKPDVIATDYGEVIVQPIKHASLVLIVDGVTIYVDPVGKKSLYNNLKSPDVILITDIDAEHFSLKTIQELDAKNTLIIAPKAVTNQLSYSYKKNAITLNNLQGVHRFGLFISAIPMYNLPKANNTFHPPGRGNGYTINIEDFSIYVSGDTAATDEMRLLYGIDIAFVCMNLPFTMGVEEAADGVLDFQPKIIYPYSYKGKEEVSNIEKFKEIVTAENPNIEVRLKDWYTIKSTPDVKTKEQVQPIEQIKEIKK